MKTERPNKFMLLPSELRYSIEKIVNNKAGLYVQNKKEMIEELMMLYYKNDSLNKAKAEVREKFVDEDCECPLCKQNVKLYRRKLNYGMAAFLLGLYKLSGGDVNVSVHYNDVHKLIGFNPNDYSNLERWGLILYAGEKSGTGYWCITSKGLLFLTGQLNIPEKVFIYNSKTWGFSPEEISFKEALGARFELLELVKDNQFFAGKNQL